MASFGDSVMDVQMSDGSVMRGMKAAARTTKNILGTDEQAIRLTWDENGRCRDSIVVADAVMAFLHGGIGGTQAPLLYPAAPAREILRTTGSELNNSFLEVLGLIGYGGKDTSARAIGFSQVYEDVEAIVAPFGSFLGNNIAIGIGGGVMFEGGRTRFPLYGELRLNWPGGARVAVVTQYLPDSCQFGIPGDPASAPPWKEFQERPHTRVDSTVFFTRDQTIITRPFHPYLYIDAGTVFDGNFDGAGVPSNAVNPDFRKPLLLGIGIGHSLGNNWTIALGYRYMQLHLATPCPECIDRSIINRNVVHSITLRAGWRMSW